MSRFISNAVSHYFGLFDCRLICDLVCTSLDGWLDRLGLEGLEFCLFGRTVT